MRTRRIITFAAGILLTGHAIVAQQVIPVNNPSFEDVDTILSGGVWPEVDVPANTYWIESGPIGELTDYPSELIPDNGLIPETARFDTGVFYNLPGYMDGDTFVPLDSYIANTNDQLAYVFAAADQGIGLRQILSATYDSALTYTLTIGMAKSYYLPPDLYDANAMLGIRLLYEDAQSEWQVLSQTNVLASDLLDNWLTDYMVESAVTPEATGSQIGIELVPLQGEAGVWVFDNVRLTAIPEPGSGVLLATAATLLLGVRRRT